MLKLRQIFLDFVANTPSIRTYPEGSSVPRSNNIVVACVLNERNYQQLVACGKPVIIITKYHVLLYIDTCWSHGVLLQQCRTW